MSDTARKVLVVLEHHRGEAEAIKARAIALRVGLFRAHGEKRISDAVTELRREHGFLIAGGPTGYYMAVTEAERRAIIEDLDSRIAGLARTRRAIAQRHPEYAQLALEV